MSTARATPRRSVPIDHRAWLCLTQVMFVLEAVVAFFDYVSLLVSRSSPTHPHPIHFHSRTAMDLAIAIVPSWLIGTALAAVAIQAIKNSFTRKLAGNDGMFLLVIVATCVWNFPVVVNCIEPFPEVSAIVDSGFAILLLWTCFFLAGVVRREKELLFADFPEALPQPQGAAHG